MENSKLRKLSPRELVELARKCMANDSCALCVMDGDDSCTRHLIMMLADKLEELDTKWIPCEVAKPTEEDEYLVMIAGATKPTVLYYDVEEEGFYGEDDELNQEWYPVTHWAMLPEGPEMPRVSPRPTVKRCATCRHEDKLGDEERCLECEKHNLWEERR